MWSLVPESSFIPAVHVEFEYRELLLEYIANAASPTAFIPIAQKVTVDAPVIAESSSRGPIISQKGSMLNPRVTAPGVDILAGYSPRNAFEPALFAQISGTSMSSPHVAGLFALMKEARPTWSPPIMHSALQLTASDTLTNYESISGSQDVVARRIWSEGSGHVDPRRMLSPSILMPLAWADYVRYTCTYPGYLTADTCAAFSPSIEPWDLNMASIAR